jgi:hypothetical protein
MAVEETGDDELPPRPQRPDPSECCKSNCSPCIFEIYDQDLERWERRVAEIIAARSKNR